MTGLTEPCAAGLAAVVGAGEVLPAGRHRCLHGGERGPRQLPPPLQGEVGPSAAGVSA